MISEDARVWLGVFVSVVAFILVFGSVVGVCVYAASRHSCAETGKTTGYETRYPSIWTGCQVKVDGRWVPRDTWRNLG